MRVMFDTNVFNHVVEGKIPLERIPAEWVPVATHLQRDELERTPNEQKRVALNALFRESIQVTVPTETAVWDVSNWDEAKWSGPRSVYTPLLEALNAVRMKPNNVVDALIADTCIQNGFLLVTNDRTLKKVASEHGCQVDDLVET